MKDMENNNDDDDDHDHDGDVDCEVFEKNGCWKLFHRQFQLKGKESKYYPQNSYCNNCRYCF